MDEITEELSLNPSEANTLYICLSKLLKQHAAELQYIQANPRDFMEINKLDQGEMENSVFLIQAMQEDIKSILPNLREVVMTLQSREESQNPTSGIIV